MSPLEITAAICLLVNVYLAARANILNFLFGAIGVSIYFVIFFQAKLYADMSLQLVYLCLQFYGAYQWRYGGAQHDTLMVSRASKNHWIGGTLATLTLYFLLCFILRHYTDSTTVKIDAFTTALSLIAQWMMNRKLIENWWLWMIVDAVSIQMYLIKHLYVTAGLYAVFFVICCIGYMTWRRKSLQDIEENPEAKRKLNVQI